MMASDDTLMRHLDVGKCVRIDCVVAETTNFIVASTRTITEKTTITATYVYSFTRTTDNKQYTMIFLVTMKLHVGAAMEHTSDWSRSPENPMATTKTESNVHL